jgi:hypothetical protein
MANGSPLVLVDVVGGYLQGDVLEAGLVAPKALREELGYLLGPLRACPTSAAPGRRGA